MIWQLVQRDRISMGWTVLLAVLFGAVAVFADYLPLPPSQPTREAFHAAMALGLAMMPCFLVAIVFVVQSQRTLYEAALPIAWRDLWLSRVLTLLGLVWLPLMSAMAGGLPPLTLLAAASAYTVLILGGKSLEIRNLGSGRRLGNAALRIVLLIPLSVMLFSKQLKTAQWIVWPSAGSVLAICGLAGAILFWWSWTSIPKSFQFAPPELARVPGSESRGSSRLDSFTWAPVFRSIYGPLMMLLVFFLVGNIVTRFLWVASLVVGSVQVQIRGQCRWLLALPVSMRTLFGWVAIPQAVVIIIGCLASILIETKMDGAHGLTATGWLVEVGAELAVLYGLMFLSELPAWRRLSKLRAAPFGVLILWMPFAIGAFAPIFVLPNSAAIQRLADVLPETWWQLAGILTIPVMATYWLAEKAFREQEYRQLLIELPGYRKNR